MGTLTQYEVTVFREDGTGNPVRIYSSHALENYLRMVIRHCDGSIATDDLDLEGCKTALRYLQLTVSISKIKTPLEDIV